MPTPRISSNQAENTSYHMGIKQSEQELSSLILSFLVVVTKPISGSTSVFHNLATFIPFPSPAFICYARACTSIPIVISVGICALVNTNNVWDFSFAEEN